MTKTIIFLLTAVFLFAVSNETKVFATVDVSSLVLDKTTVNIPCPQGTTPNPKYCPDDMSVKISAEATGAKNGVAIFRYTVSGGNIVGTGANVYWDLSGIRPGKYMITAAAADDGFGFNGQVKTAEVFVNSCPDCGGDDCECPTLSIKGLKNYAKKGEIIEFEAIISGGSQDEVTYKWSVNKYGEIVEGQGTPKIKVKVLSDPPTVTVELGGLCESCLPTSASETTPIP